MALLLAVACVGAAHAGGKPVLRLVQIDPLTVRGSGFHSRERVVVKLSAKSTRSVHVIADARGAFQARFVYAPGPCVAWRVLATGASSGIASYRSSLAGCASLASGNSSTGIAGFVTRGPVTPTCTAEQPCDAPAAGIRVEAWQGGAVTRSSVTGADGAFAIHFGPGTYTVRALGRGAQPQRAQVETGHVARVAFSLDTGIR